LKRAEFRDLGNEAVVKKLERSLAAALGVMADEGVLIVR
jgi:hypothetical protein